MDWGLTAFSAETGHIMPRKIYRARVECMFRLNDLKVAWSSYVRLHLPEISLETFHDRNADIMLRKFICMPRYFMHHSKTHDSNNLRTTTQIPHAASIYQNDITIYKFSNKHLYSRNFPLKFLSISKMQNYM